MNTLPRVHPFPAERRMLATWDADADAWTDAVRGGVLPGRQITDEALVEVIRQVPTGPILDAGCGEGWLARRLAPLGHRVTGIDGSARLVERAQELGGGDFRVLAYSDAADNPRLLRGPFGTAVFNFSLLDDKATPILHAVAATLFPYGRILVQTPHPGAVDGDGEPYRDGWREDEFPGLGFPEPIPYFFRTFSRWVLELRRAGLILVETYEPLDPDTGRPVSLILSATIPERRRG